MKAKRVFNALDPLFKSGVMANALFNAANDDNVRIEVQCQNGCAVNIPVSALIEIMCLHYNASVKAKRRELKRRKYKG